METAQETRKLQAGNAEAPHTRVAFALTEDGLGDLPALPVTQCLQAIEDETAELLSQAVAGDAQALESLLALLRPRAIATALRILRNRDDAEDAVQDAFVKIWRCLPRFEGRSSLSTWVHRIVTNASVDLVRRSGNRWEHVEGAEEQAASTAEYVHNRTPEDAASEVEVQALVRTAIAALPAPHRQAIELRELEDYSYLEISEIARCPLGTVMSRLHHARNRLASDLRVPLGESAERFAA